MAVAVFCLKKDYQNIFFGGYPGAASLIGDEERFQQYIQSAIIDATINKDILMDTPIGKPALLKQTFELGAAYFSKGKKNLLSCLGMKFINKFINSYIHI